MKAVTVEDVAEPERRGGGDEVSGCEANSREREAGRLWDGRAHHSSSTVKLSNSYQFAILAGATERKEERLFSFLPVQIRSLNSEAIVQIN